MLVLITVDVKMLFRVRQLLSDNWRGEINLIDYRLLCLILALILFFGVVVARAGPIVIKLLHIILVCVFQEGAAIELAEFDGELVKCFLEVQEVLNLRTFLIILLQAAIQSLPAGIPRIRSD